MAIGPQLVTILVTILFRIPSFTFSFFLCLCFFLSHHPSSKLCVYTRSANTEPRWGCALVRTLLVIPEKCFLDAGP